MPSGIYKRKSFSMEHREKIGKSIKDFWVGKERKFSKERNEKISKAHKGKPKPWLKGKPLSEEHKRRISRTNKGRIGYMLGKHQSEEAKKKMSENSSHNRYWLGKKRPEFSGNKHPNWKNGKSSTYRVQHAPRPKPEQCEVCGSMGILCFDHNHKTGKFRGWICHRCNFALGLVKDNTETLMALIEYLKK